MVPDQRHKLKKSTRPLEEIICALGASDEIAGYDSAAFVQRAGEVIARAASERKPPEKPVKDGSS